MHAHVYMLINGFYIEVIVFRLGIMDACLYLYDHNRFMYRMNKFRIRVRSLEICPIY
jgi:hypothetical protein